MSTSFDFEHPELVTVGTVGEPGRRVFFLQAAQDGEIVSLKLEKQQAAALGRGLAEILSDLPAATSESRDLKEPVEEAWAVGAMQIAYDAEADRVVLLAEEIEVEGESAAVARLLVTRDQAAAIVGRVESLVTSGRPPCPFCGHPLDPAGHTCPKTNGHRPPER